MIMGLGSDVVNIHRFTKVLERFGDRFLQRSFTEYERQSAKKISHAEKRNTFLAKRFAAKEACAKALGTGFREGLCFHHIGVINDAQGKPSLMLTDNAEEKLHRLSGGKTPYLHLSLSDDDPVAMAVVIISV